MFVWWITAYRYGVECDDRDEIRAKSIDEKPILVEYSNDYQSTNCNNMPSF